MAKEFDIYLNKRLTECDIIVYSIPFRDGLTATNRMILESCLESYTLQKFIAVETGSELVSHIDKMIKTCNERLHMASTWGIDLEFQTHYVLNPVPTVIEIAPNDDLQTLRNMFMSVEDKLQITAASIDAMVAKSLGEGGSRMNIDAEVRQSLKNSLLRPAAALPVDTKVRQISEQNFLTIDAPVEPSAEIVDLCYRFYTAAGTAMQIAAAVIETEIHFSLGSGESGIELSASADGTAKKYEAIQSTVEILAGITEKITQFMAPEKGGILLSAAATPILKRHRLLNEMDADTLLTYDDMALEDIDYIILYRPEVTRVIYIKLDDSMNLVITVNEPIYRGDNLNQKIIYLIPLQVGEIDMLTATPYLSYIRADGVADIVRLERQSEKYKEAYYQYVFPVSCRLTKFPGEVCSWLQIFSGTPSNPTIAKSGECLLYVEESKNMDDYICDHQLSAIYEMQKKTEDTESNMDAIQEEIDKLVKGDDVIHFTSNSGNDPVDEDAVIQF